MKPSKKSGVAGEGEKGELLGGVSLDIGGTRSDDVELVEGDEGGGGAYGRPRSEEEDEESDRSRERG